MNEHQVLETHSHSHPPKLGLPLPLDAADDEKFVSGLSTILVASIQETKDRISQIEYIFCTQLYPNLQSKSKTLQKLESRCKQKETELSLTIEELRVENRRISEEKRRRIEELEREVWRKGKEVDEGMVLQKSLVELVQSKGSLLAEREKEFRESEENRKVAIARVSELEEGIENWERERERLLKKIDDLDEKLGMKTREVEEGEELREKLREEMELKRLEVLESEKNLGVYEKENKVLVDKVKCLEERLGEVSNRMGSYQKLLEQVESVTSELQAEKIKRNRLTDAYKRLKSQHNYLREKVGLTEENMLHQNKLEIKSNLSKPESPITEHGLEFDNPNTLTDACKAAKVMSEILEEDSGGLEDRTPDVFVPSCYTNKMKEKVLEDDKGANLSPPSSSFHGVPKCPSSTKSVSVSGIKRPASAWRQTRAHQSRAGPDPHDDFLDTPLENIRENLNKDLNKEDLPEPIQKDISVNSSDDETQDLNAKSSPQKKQSSIPVANKRSFKYVEPVRKKTERENLKGVECKQCRKFYEAVLPNGDGKDPDGSKQNFRCEHHDGVSRHRYRYVPPLTPEGFWNIGFESEI